VRIVYVTNAEMVSDTYELEKGWRRVVKDENEVAQGDVLAKHKDVEQPLVAENEGRVRVEGRTIIVSRELSDEEVYEIPSNARLIVKNGDCICYPKCSKFIVRKGKIFMTSILKSSFAK